MHCRYYKEHLLGAYEKVTQEAPGKLSRALLMVKESLQYINDPVQLAGNVIDNGTTKFSVWGSANCSMINLSFINGTCLSQMYRRNVCSQLSKQDKYPPM